MLGVKPSFGAAMSYSPTSAVDAGFWPRVGARLIDDALFNLVGLVLLGMAAGLEAHVLSPWVLAIASAVNFVLWYLYLFCMTTRYGQTVGKMAAGVRVETPDGQLPTVPVTLRRVGVELGFRAIAGLLITVGVTMPRGAQADYLPSTLAFVGIGLIAGLADPLAILFTPRRQALHDVEAGTYVVRTARGPIAEFVGIAVVAVLVGGAVDRLGDSFGVGQYVAGPGTDGSVVEVGDLVYTNRLVFRLRPPRRGEAVECRAQRSGKHRPQTVAGRVVGVPGDRMRVFGRRLWLNDQVVAQLSEGIPRDYAWPAGAATGALETVPPDELVVLSEGSLWPRMRLSEQTQLPAPCINREGIVARLGFRYWPPDRIGTVGGR